MNRIWPIIGVADVAASFAWYQSLLCLPPSSLAHNYWGQLLDPDGTVLLCLHQWGAHDHPSLSNPHQAIPGHGLLLFFRVANFAACLQAARALIPGLAEPPGLNPNTGTPEFSLRDPDGYHVTISALAGA
jgi:catechol 2,3-dioxygenase-like lactoylglutathione lyase family enzyme